MWRQQGRMCRSRAFEAGGELVPGMQQWHTALFCEELWNSGSVHRRSDGAGGAESETLIFLYWLNKLIVALVNGKSGKKSGDERSGLMDLLGSEDQTENNLPRRKSIYISPGRWTNRMLCS